MMRPRITHGRQDVVLGHGRLQSVHAPVDADVRVVIPDGLAVDAQLAKAFG